MAITVTSPPSPGPPETPPGARGLGRLAGAGVLAALAALTGLAWLALGPIGRGMMPAGMAGMAMAPPQVTVADLALGFAMWAVMMPGMMLPSAAPMILTVARVHRSRPARGGVSLPLAAFVAGYLLVWTGFSAVAALAQWGLARGGLIGGMDGRMGPMLGGAVFVAAGLYQLSPLKLACLGRCRSPLGFLLAHWRDGVGGALRMGARHGVVCLGCCWALMALLFAVGAMNLVWVAGLGGLVLVEKLAPGGGWVARASGVALLVAGVALAGGFAAF